MQKTKMTLGFIAGIAIGAIAGILIAPDKGETTRRKIMDASGGLANNLKDTFSSFLNNLTPQPASETTTRVKSTSAGEEKIRRVMHNAKEEIV